MSNEGLSENEQLDVPAISLPVIDEAPVEAIVETPVVETTAVAVAVPSLDDSSLYIHRELSQLQFNIRVLEQALDESYPLLGA